MRTVLVTGSEGGLGGALCRAFRQRGDRVLALDRVPADGALPDAFLQVDLAAAVADAGAWVEAAARLRSWVGPRLDVLVNNAAVQRLGGLSELAPADWRETIAVNLTAPLWLAQALATALTAARGVVVNVSSVHARATKPGFLAYAVSKAALDGLTRALALEMAPAVRVVGIAPAAIATPMLEAGFAGRPAERERLASYHPLGRVATAEEIAGMVCAVASADAAFVSGTTIAVDGGILGRLHDPG